MAIQFSGGTYRNDHYTTVASIDAFLGNVKTTLEAAGWTSTTLPHIIPAWYSTNPANNEYIRFLDADGVTSRTYTFKTTIDNGNFGEILIGATADDSFANLAAALTSGAGSGTLYSSNTTSIAYLAASKVAVTQAASPYSVGVFEFISTALYAGAQPGHLFQSKTVTNTTVGISSGNANSAGGYEFLSAATPAGLVCKIRIYSDHSSGLYLMLLDEFGRDIANNPGEAWRRGATSSSLKGYSPYGFPSQNLSPGITGNSHRVIATKYHVFIRYTTSAVYEKPSTCVSFGTFYVPTRFYRKAVTGASNATPIVITEIAHGRSSGDTVYIDGVTGNTAANGIHTITVVNVDSYSLNTSVGNGAYISGGVVAGVSGPKAQVAQWAWISDSYSDNYVGFRPFLYSTMRVTNTGLIQLLNGNRLAGRANANAQTVELVIPKAFSDTAQTTELTWLTGEYVGGDPIVKTYDINQAASVQVGQLYDVMAINKASQTFAQTGSYSGKNWAILSEGSTIAQTLLHVVP